MPMNCCVPECTKKVYRDESGEKISFFKFPTKKSEKKRWLHAIRREEGKYFRVTKHTKVCSRHFRTGNLRKTLGGKYEVKDGVVPLVFPWIRTSPRKRKEPTARNFDVLASSSAARNFTSDVPVEEPANELPASVSDFELHIGSTSQDCEMQTEFTDHKVYLTEIINNSDKKIQVMEQEIKELKCQLQNMQRQNDNLNKRLFTLENLKSKDSSAAYFILVFPTGKLLWLFTHILTLTRGERISHIGVPHILASFVITLTRIKQMNF